MAKSIETGSPIAVANQSSLSPLAGKPTTKEMLVDVARLELAYFERRPDLQDPDEHYRELTGEFGISYYTRIDAPASREQRRRLQKLSPDTVRERDLAGEPITAKLTRSPGNNAPIGGLKIKSQSGWFAARPSRTEDIYKIYAESFKGKQHLNSIVDEAQMIVNNALGSSAAGPQ